MRVLGINTSSHINAIGLIDGNQILADLTWEAMDNSLQKIILNIDLVLKEKCLTLENVEGFAVGIGPGSWTGLRVGVTVGKILAYTTKKPICGISSLDVLAYQARDNTMLLCPLIDAGKETVYGAFYRSQEGTVFKVGDYYVGDIQGLLESTKEPILFLGKAALLYNYKIVGELGSLASFGDEMEDVQKGSSIALLASPHFERGESNNALSLAPLYLKESAAQALLARHQAMS